jgi:hypothetical protein
MKLFPARESLVSDIPAGDGKNDNLFYNVGNDPFGIGMREHILRLPLLILLGVTTMLPSSLALKSLGNWM